jgi:hypothetical protein
MITIHDMNRDSLWGEYRYCINTFFYFGDSLLSSCFSEDDDTSYSWGTELCGSKLRVL